jgi:acetyltransferase
VPAADQRAVAAVLVALSRLVLAFPEVREVDINPLLADASGVVALDARIVLG